MEPVQLVTPEGDLRPDPQIDFTPTAELCQDLYRGMRLTRRFDEEAFSLQRQGELGLWLQCLGQEGAQVGSISAVRRSDFVFPSYREHAVALYRGVKPGEMLVQWRGNRHSGWNPKDYNFNIYTLVLAAQLLHATGYAMGIQKDGVDEIVLAYFGDGSSSEGEANEAFNFAATARAPIVFFCQNNQWAISTPSSTQSATRLYQRGQGFGLRTELVDGNDAVAVHAVTKAVAEHTRAGGGPALIEAMTYRMGGHSTSDDPGRYRALGELETWQAKDPVDRVHHLLEKQGWADETYFKQVEEEADDIAATTRHAVLNMPVTELAAIFPHILAEETPAIRAERESFEAYLASFEH